MLTLKPMLTSPMSGMVRDEQIITDSGGHLQGRTSDSRLPKPPLLDSLFGNEIGSEAHLLGHSKASGMVAVDNAVTNSGEFVRSGVQNRERWGERGGV
jgi:hypothetical protein